MGWLENEVLILTSVLIQVIKPYETTPGPSLGKEGSFSPSTKLYF